MYLRYWGLREQPFVPRQDPQAYIASAPHEEALARLQYVVESRRRLGLLLGTPGSGKSLTLAVFGRQLRTLPGQTVRLNLQGLSPHEFLWQLAARLSLCPERASGPFELWQALADRLTENHRQQWTTVVLLDDANLAPRKTLEQVVRLARSEPICPNRLTMIVASQPNIKDLGRELLELAELRIDLGTWELADTEHFISACLARAGRNQKDSVFQPEALLRLHELSQGAIRRVAQLADLALLAAAGSKLQQIDAHTVEAVYEELGVMDACVSDVQRSGSEWLKAQAV
ncbi:MAG TPA: AAA family ATPase [Pirellulales bacterium]|nr:AAA family ATPase [Pirellulales bacterium]